MPAFTNYAAAFAISLMAATPAFAQEAVSVTIKNKHFSPSTLHASANKPLRITVHNGDSAAAEFESRTLRVEKVVPPGSTVVVNVKPLAPGSYEFFDDFNQANTGVLIAK